MKLKLYTFILVFSAMVLKSSALKPHPIKLTASLVEYNEEEQTIRMECRVFIDDFENAINGNYNTSIEVKELSNDDIAIIEAFFRVFYKVTINGKKLDFTYTSSEVVEEYNVFNIKFKYSKMKIKKGDVFTVENTLFFDEFGYLQTNGITLRIPSFLEEEAYHIATHDNYLIRYNF